MLRRYVPLVLLLALVASACQVRFDSVLEVRDDESGIFALEIGFDEEFRQLAEQQGGGFDLSETNSDIPAGWVAEPFAEGEFEGTRITTEFSDFVDLQQKLRQLEESGGSDEATPNALLDGLQLTRDGDSFSFRAQLEQVDEEFSDLAGGGAGFDGLDPAAFLESLFKVRFRVTLPGTLGDHNADAVDGNTLVWNISLDGQDRTLSATSNIGGGFGLSGLTPVLTGVAALVLVGGLGYAIYRRRSEAAQAGDEVNPVTTALAPPPQDPVDGDPFGA